MPISHEISPILVPRQIPSPPFDFIGRSLELNKLLEYIERGTTIVGIYGMGGIGKTALAFKLAERLRDRYPDGQLFVDLRGSSTNPLIPAEAMAHIIHAYVPDSKLPGSEAELYGLYHSVMAGKRVLLLLDNAMGKEQVEPLIHPEGCNFIVTSRKKFAMPGLIKMDLDALNPSDARNLLLAISGRIGSEIDELAQLCGYFPLALRAAGSLLANAQDLDLAEFVEELRSERTRLNRLGVEEFGLDVEASFNLSYSHLSDETAKTLLLMSIFPADFDAEAEEIICQDEGHKNLSELVRLSMVGYESSGKEGRYRLNDLVRLFASNKLEEKLGSDTRLAALQRHAEHYRDVLSTSNKLYMLVSRQ